MTSIVRERLSGPSLRADELVTDVRTHAALEFSFICARAIGSLYLSITRLSSPMGFSDAV